jgi:hypothetical protein
MIICVGITLLLLPTYIYRQIDTPAYVSSCLKRGENRKASLKKAKKEKQRKSTHLFLVL